MDKKPEWLKAKAPQGVNFEATREVVNAHHLHTVCQSAHCPNIGECWNRKTATFMILGDICTRNCAFCAVKTGRPLSVDHSEPEKVADSISRMDLKYAVITSVTRDDLPDHGAQIWAETICAVRHKNPDTLVEVLIPDFNNNPQLLDIVLNSKPDVLNHNLETVERLQPTIRRTASYKNSLGVIAYASQRGLKTKSGLMLGLGEEWDEIRQAIKDLREVGCEILTLGQYLQPSKQHWPVMRWVTPGEFNELKVFAEVLGFHKVQAGPLVRSSYNASA